MQELEDLLPDQGKTLTNVERDEAVKLGAIDTEFYAQTFFPKTFRQSSPPFARSLWAPMEDPASRLVNLVVFRGASKTTRLRTFASKRIAYGISRTILYIGASERDAIRSVQWLRTQMEKNTSWSSTFGLKQGRKWQETEIEIEHTGFGHTVWVLGAGITGSLRGINFDDYRPDLIIVDDPQTDETAATEEQRNKIADLILGAVKNSLAPVSEEPNAKLIMAITPQHSQDVSQQASKDAQWNTRIYPCWTPETFHLPVNQQVSCWEERFPTISLRADKTAAIKRNKLSIFKKEMECSLITPETSQFRPQWLNIREPNATPKGCFAVLAIDPVPPPSARQLSKNLLGKDWEAHYVWGRHNGEYHLLDYARNRGHEPSWSVSTALALARKHRVVRIIVDAVNYQRTLKWILEQEMKKRGIYYSVVPVADGMKKFARITGVLTGLATEGKLWIGPEHSIFADQFESYPNVEHDDDLDASALALQDISNPYLSLADGSNEFSSQVEDLELVRNCP